MTNYKDTDLREALRRKYADTPQMPTGMSERLMKRMDTTQNTPRRRYWPYITTVLSIAASILLLIVLLPKQESTEQSTMVAKKNTVPTDSVQPTEYIVSTEATERTIVAQAIPDKYNTNKATVNESQKPKVDSASAAENLADCIARLEAEMEALDDSVRDAHLEKLIAADARLQRLVNHIVGKQAEQALNGLQNDSTANYINF
jgi:hypothetical protein